MLIFHWGNISQNLRVNKSKKKGGGQMSRSKQKKRRNSLNFGEIEDAKRIAVTKIRDRDKASTAVKAFALFATTLQALSTIVEAITKIVRSFISQCMMQSRRDFSIDLFNMAIITNGWQNKFISRFSLLLSFL